MEVSKRSKIAVLCGGISDEREISLRSGKNCFEALKRKGYENSFLLDLKSIDDFLTLKKNNTDIVFLICHGNFGEDGAAQGVLEWLRIPYIGSSILGSSISMDKWITKQIAQNNKILTPRGILITSSNKESLDFKTFWEELSKASGSLFLKPRAGGSSVNTFRIKSLDDLNQKINNLNLQNSDYLLEEQIIGKEITTSLIKLNNEYKVLPILELKPKKEFYDYEAKYTKGMTEFILPAELSPKCKDTVEKTAKEIFHLVNCSSFGRVDFIVDKSENPYLLEVNSLPGMTETSDLPAQAKCMGIEFDDLVEIVLKTARLHK